MTAFEIEKKPYLVCESVIAKLAKVAHFIYMLSLVALEEYQKIILCQ